MPGPTLDQLPPEDLLRLLYRLALERDPDPTGAAAYLPQLEKGSLTPHALLEYLVYSNEWSLRTQEFGPSLHVSRRAFIRSLPPARHILDLGGTALGSDAGALVVMGYPYQFDRLTIVDLPSDDRHDIYREDARRDVVTTALGPVQYQYHSMADLSRYEDASFDLVFSGESIEHVTPHEADAIFEQAWRILKPGGYLAIDTPNARVTRLQQAAFIDPDHKYEYTHEELSRKLLGHGFEIVEARGITYAGQSMADGRFSIGEAAANGGLFWDIRNCYLLAYICRRPVGLATGPAMARRATAGSRRKVTDEIRRRLPAPVKQRLRQVTGRAH